MLLPFTLIEVARVSAVQAGAALLPLPLLIGLGSRATGRLAARIGSRRLLTVGAAIVSLGFLLFLSAGRGAIDYWSDVLPGILFVSTGMAICVAPLMAAVMASVDTGHVGTASGFNSAIARIGGLLATASIGFVFADRSSATALLGGYRMAALGGGHCSGYCCRCRGCIGRRFGPGSPLIADRQCRDRNEAGYQRVMKT